METQSIYSTKNLSGSFSVPGDKSISHRALILSSLAQESSEIRGLSWGADVQATWNCLNRLGASIQQKGSVTIVNGRGCAGYLSPRSVLDCQNSGTTMRMLMGVLSSMPFSSILVGDESLNLRPMARVAEPLRKMGAEIRLEKERFAPVHLEGKFPLSSIRYKLPVASAQLKSALLLAGLRAEGKTTLTGLIQSRDHTERMLKSFGVEICIKDHQISLTGQQKLTGAKILVPGDFSSAAFWIAAAVLVPGSEILIRNVSLNPTRTGFLKVIQRMGAQVEIEPVLSEPEPLGHILARSSQLRGTTVEKSEIPYLIDELPLIAILGAFAEGKTIIREATELRLKETDRIRALVKNLTKMGSPVEEIQDGMEITGKAWLSGAEIDSFRDHRIAMAFSIAGLRALGVTLVHHSECVRVSYPGFFDTLKKLTAGKYRFESELVV